MKRSKKVFTEEQLQMLKNVYYIDDLGVFPIIGGNRPTAKTLKIINHDELGNPYVYTAHDFERDAEGDFSYEGGNGYVRRDSMPKKVLAILDAVNDTK